MSGRAPELAFVKRFDPNERRDWRGRWSIGGGSPGSGAAPKWQRMAPGRYTADVNGVPYELTRVEERSSGGLVKGSHWDAVVDQRPIVRASTLSELKQKVAEYEQRGAPLAVRDVVTGFSPRDARTKLGKESMRAVEHVEHVHGYPKYTALTPTKRVGRRELGSAYASFQPTTEELWINKDITSNVDPMRTIPHELGHKLDWTLGRLDPGIPDDVFASEVASAHRRRLDARGPLPAAVGNRDMMGPRWTTLMDALEGSDAYSRIIDPKGAFGDRANYWASPPELFARAYAQWIAQREGVAFSYGDAKPEAAIREGTMWSDSDFRPIGRAFDELIGGLGLLKGQT